MVSVVEFFHNWVKVARFRFRYNMVGWSSNPTIGHWVKLSTKWNHKSNEKISQSMGVTCPLTLLEISKKDELGEKKTYKSWEQKVFDGW